MSTISLCTEHPTTEFLKQNGVILIDGTIDNKLTIELFRIIKESNSSHGNMVLLNEKILTSNELKKLTSSQKLQTLSYTENLIFVGTKIIKLKSNVRPTWSFHEDLYLKQRAFDQGATLWIPLTDNKNDGKDKLSVFIVPKHYGYCDPIYQHLNFLEKLELPTENIESHYKRYADNELHTLWSEILAGQAMSKILDRSCFKLETSLSSAFLCDKLSLINFEYISNNNTDLTLVGLTFYSEHSVFKYRGLNGKGSNVNILSTINDCKNDGLPLTGLISSNNERPLVINKKLFDIDKLKKKFDPRICFD